MCSKTTPHIHNNWICWMVQQPLWNVPLLLLSYIITLLIHLLSFSFIIITCLTFVFHMAVVSYSCHRSYCTLNLLLLFMKLSKLWYHLKQKASFLLYLFLSLSLPLSTKPLSCHLEASSHTTTMCLILCSKKKILGVESRDLSQTDTILTMVSSFPMLSDG